MRNALFVVAAAASLAGAVPAAAQGYTRDLSAIPFFRDGAPYLEPLSGGLNAPMHQFYDIDADGDLDLFIFDSDFYRETMFFRNNGDSAHPAFVLEPGGGIAGASFSFWYRFVDYDGDGQVELLTDDGSTGVRVWRNDGSPAAPQWGVETAQLRDTAGFPLFAGFGSLPGFADLDGDGLVDFLSNNSADGSFNYYSNVGSQGAPAWALASNRLSDITITSDTCTKGGALPASVPAGQGGINGRGGMDGPGGMDDQAAPEAGPALRTLHGMGAVALNDLDANGTVDLFYGDFFSHSIFYLRNDGTAGEPLLECSSDFFPPDGSLHTTGFNQATFADIDADGNPDLFVGVLNSRTRHSFWYYHNDGSPGVPDYRLQTTDYVNTLDVGQNAKPAFADLDADGDLDLVIGNNEGQLWYFVNDGSILSPVYRLADTAFAGIAGNFSYAPAFADLDADGNPDLLLGRFDGRVIIFINGGGGAFTPTDTLTAGQYAVPAAADVDGDGDLDLVVGKGDGTLTFFRNTGTSRAPVFSRETDAYLSADVGDNARPAFRFNPRSGLADLFVAPAAGDTVDSRPHLRYYLNVGGGAEPPFVLDDAHYGPPLPYQPAPAFGDPDGDGDDDLLVGTSKGGLVYYRYDGGANAVGDAGNVPAPFRLNQNFPNPFNGATVISFELPEAADVSAGVYDISGRRVARLAGGRRGPGPGRIEWNAGDLPSGVYYYRMSAGGKALARRMMLIR